jgi:hypothetical protein
MKSAIFAGFAAYASAAYLHRGEEVVAGSYIIRLSSHRRGEDIQAHVDKVKAALGEKFQLLHVYSALSKFGFSGYSAKLSPEALEFLLRHSDVLEIEEDQIVRNTYLYMHSLSKPYFTLCFLSRHTLTKLATPRVSLGGAFCVPTYEAPTVEGITTTTPRGPMELTWMHMLSVRLGPKDKIIVRIKPL